MLLDLDFRERTTLRLKVGIHRISKRTSRIRSQSSKSCRQRDLPAVRKLDASTRFRGARGIPTVSGLTRPSSLPPCRGSMRSQRATTTNPLLLAPFYLSDRDRILLSSFRRINNRSLPFVDRLLLPLLSSSLISTPPSFRKLQSPSFNPRSGSHS